MSAAVRGLQAGFEMGSKVIDGTYRMAALRSHADEQRRMQAFRDEWNPVAKRLSDVIKGAGSASPPTEQAADSQALGLRVMQPPGHVQQETKPAPAAAPTAPTGSWKPGKPVVTHDDVRAATAYHAKRAGLDPELVLRQMEVESAYNPNAVSPRGARGLMQIMPETGRDPGFGIAPLRDDSLDENIRFGTDYLAAMMQRYGGDTERALAAYNAGPGRVGTSGPLPNIKETRDYVAKIMAGKSPDPRMADTGGQASPAIDPRSLPARDGGLGESPDEPIRRFMAQSDPNELAQVYQEAVAVMMAHPEMADKVAPSLEAFSKLGIARWMQDYEGDPASLDYFKHIGKGMAMFGQPMDPSAMLDASLKVGQDRRDTLRLEDDLETGRQTRENQRNKDRRDAESTEATLEESRYKFQQKQSYDSLKSIYSALSDGKITDSEKQLLESMDVKDFREEIVNEEVVYSAQIPGMEGRVSGTAAELKAYIEDLAARIGSEESAKDQVKTVTNTGRYGESEQKLIQIQPGTDGNMTGREIPIAGAEAQGAETDDVLRRQAKMMADERIKEMATLFGRDPTDFKDYGGSRAQARVMLTEQYYQQLKNGSAATPPAAPGLGAPPPPPSEQPSQQSDSRGGMRSDPSVGVYMTDGNGKETLFKNGTTFKARGIVYKVVNGDIVEVTSP